VAWCGSHIAAVAVARKLAVIIWHMLTRGEDYAGVRPALHAKKLRDLELRSGQPERRGQRGSAYKYNWDWDCPDLVDGFQAWGLLSASAPCMVAS
jgi:hypothetical protein